MNELIVQLGECGVLLTPFYPAQYYGGPIFRDNEGWQYRYNRTIFFHRTIEEAEDTALKYLLRT